jgi:hypothetical protein
MPACNACADIPSTLDTLSSIHGTSSGLAGASENPQLPPTAVVTPCQDEGDAVASKWSWAS